MVAPLIKQIVVSAGLALLLTVVLFGVSLLPTGAREITPVETINGIPYVTTGEVTDVSEDLAHFDIKLQEPVLAKRLTLDFDYNPGTVKTLAVGIRGNSFWLSYDLQPFYEATTDHTSGWHHASVTVPLSAALADTDRSIDAMFVTNATPDLVQLATNRQETTTWQLRHLQAHVSYAGPTLAEFKDYIKSVITRERPV